MAIFDIVLPAVSTGPIQVDTDTGTYRVYDPDTEELQAEVLTLPPESVLTLDLITAAAPGASAPEAIADLQFALITLRAATADHIITPDEAAALETIVIPALESFRDADALDPQAIFTALLVVAQIVQGVYIMGKIKGATVTTLASTINAHSNRLDQLEAAVAAIQAQA
jgi:hypothetical protein